MNESWALCPFDELVQSKLFTFRVGKDEDVKEFMVHSKAVAATSWYFRALVNNGMAESQTRTVEYPDVEPEDFARFVEYAYRHEYTVPSWAQDKTPVENNFVPPPASPHEPTPPSPPPAEPAAMWAPEPEPEPVPVTLTPVSAQDDWGIPSAYTSKAQAKKKTYQRSLRADFDKRCYLTSNQPKTVTLAAFEPQGNTASDQDFTPIFLAHARLYTFACIRLVDPLKYLTLHKLHQTLLSFQLYERRVRDVVELARYAYKQGEDRRDDDTLDELRKLVVDYIVCEVSTFGKHPVFVTFLSDGGEFVVDFWRTVYKDRFL